MANYANVNGFQVPQNVAPMPQGKGILTKPPTPQTGGPSRVAPNMQRPMQQPPQNLQRVSPGVYRNAQGNLTGPQGQRLPQQGQQMQRPPMPQQPQQPPQFNFNPNGYNPQGMDPGFNSGGMNWGALGSQFGNMNRYDGSQYLGGPQSNQGIQSGVGYVAGQAANQAQGQDQTQQYNPQQQQQNAAAGFYK